MFNLPHIQHYDFTIRCKKCCENIPAPVGTMSDFWIAAQWTERTPESIIAPPALSWDGKAGPLILRSLANFAIRPALKPATSAATDSLYAMLCNATPYFRVIRNTKNYTRGEK